MRVVFGEALTDLIRQPHGDARHWVSRAGGACWNVARVCAAMGVPTGYGGAISTHAPFGDGVVDFDALLPRLARERLPHDWWTIDLCFWSNAWDVTERCKKSLDELNRKYG